MTYKEFKAWQQEHFGYIRYRVRTKKYIFGRKQADISHWVDVYTQGGALIKTKLCEISDGDLQGFMCEVCNVKNA